MVLYNPIVGDDTIRLLEILPGSGIDVVACRLRTVQFSDAPQYEALSYCWGDALFNMEAYCNGERLAITTNLYSALSHLRNDNKLRVLWVDAICINQADIDERNQQVRLMRQIYEKAEAVVVWLGAEAQYTYLGILLVSKLVALADSRRDAMLDRNTLVKQNTATVLRDRGLPNYRHNAWKGFFELLHRPWFQRGWVVQEAAVAYTIIVCCGRFTVPWHNLTLALSYSNTIGLAEEYLPEIRAYSIALTRSSIIDGQYLSLFSLLLQHRLSVTTDPRDKIFALCGIAHDAGLNSLDIEIDYHPNNSAQVVYRDFIVKMLKRDKNLDALSIPNDSKALQLPSWIPDFSVPITTSSFMSQKYDPKRYCPYYASLSSQCTPEFSHDGRLLILAGHRVDAIVGISETLVIDMGRPIGFALWSQTKEIFKGRKRNINQWHLARLTSRKRYVTGEEMDDAYWQTLLAGYYPEKSLLPARETTKAHYSVFRRAYLRHAYLRLLPSPIFEFALAVMLFVEFLAVVVKFLIGLPLNPAPMGFIGMMYYTVGNRKLITTRKGFIGLAGAATQPGDTIIVCKGGKMPLVVRREDPANFEFKLISDCYIHGIMHGEAFEEQRCEAIALC